MDDSELNDRFNTIKDYLQNHRVQLMVQDAKIQVLQANLAAFWTQIGVPSISGKSHAESISDAVREVVNKRLAEISDDDPATATALRNLIKDWPANE